MLVALVIQTECYRECVQCSQVCHRCVAGSGVHKMGTAESIGGSDQNFGHSSIKKQHDKVMCVPNITVLQKLTVIQLSQNCLLP